MSDRNAFFFSDTDLDTVLRERESLDVFCSLHPLSLLRKGLASMGVVPASDLRRLPSGSRIRLTGMVIFFHTPPVRTGRRIIFATLEDETAIFDLVITPEAQTRWSRLVYDSEILTVEGRLWRQGRKGLSISVTMISAVPQLCGTLEKVVSELLGPIPL